MNATVTVRPFVGVNTDRNPMVVIKVRTTRVVSTPHLKGKIEAIDRFVAERDRDKPHQRDEKGHCIRESQAYNPQGILGLIDELRQRGYVFTGMVHKILPEHVVGGGRKPKVFHAYAFRFELPLQAKLRGEKNPVFDEMKGDLFTLLENLVHDRNMHAMMAYANPIMNGNGAPTGLEWLSVNIVDHDAHFTKNPKKNGNSRSQWWNKKYVGKAPKVFSSR